MTVDYFLLFGATLLAGAFFAYLNRYSGDWLMKLVTVIFLYVCVILSFSTVVAMFVMVFKQGVLR